MTLKINSIFFIILFVFSLLFILPNKSYSEDNNLMDIYKIIKTKPKQIEKTYSQILKGATKVNYDKYEKAWIISNKQYKLHLGIHKNKIGKNIIGKFSGQ